MLLRAGDVRELREWASDRIERINDLMKSISANDLKRRLDGSTRPFLLDVREPQEMADGVIAGSVNIPMDDVDQRLHEVPRDRDIVVICHLGMRSASVAKMLESLGYDRVVNLSGGMDAWLRQR